VKKLAEKNGKIKAFCNYYDRKNINHRNIFRKTNTTSSGFP